MWKCKLDILDRENGYIWDLKTTGKELFAETYVPRLKRRANFIADFNYGQQLASYRYAVNEVDNQLCNVGIMAVKKPSKLGASVDQQLFPWASDNYHILDALLPDEETVDRIIRLRAGEIEPNRCNVCEYCRTHRTAIKHFMSYYSE